MPRAADLAAESHGPRIFSLLGVSGGAEVGEGARDVIARRLADLPG